MIQKKRVAICFSGQVRTIRTAILYFSKNLVNDPRIQFDIFCVCESKDIELVKELLNPLYIEAEDLSSAKDVIKNITNNNYKKYFFQESNKNFIRNYVFQTCNWDQSFQCVKRYSSDNNVKYDAVVRMRYDFILLQEINRNEIFEHLVRDEIIFASFGIDLKTDFQKKMYNDTFAIGTYNTMEKYFSLFNHIEQSLQDFGLKSYGIKSWLLLILGKTKRFAFGIESKNIILKTLLILLSQTCELLMNKLMGNSLLNPERLLYVHCINQNLHVNVQNLDFAIVREKGQHIAIINLI